MNPLLNREITYESSLERDLAYILLAHSDVADVQDQVPIDYDDNGMKRKHTIDLVATLKDGTKTAFFVKPATRVKSSGIEETVELIREQAPKDFADHYEIRTGDHITRVRAENARLIHRARRTRCEEDIAIIAKVAATLRGAVTIQTLLAASMNNGNGFYAVVCLIDDRILDHVGQGLITYSSLVKPNQSSKM
ncbi:hypothetical protein [Rhodopseudomonas sp. B29]|uniref:hypothetical protein n=1 Tax=Rhodopseudomonas sp. B29 TaxID=95607 RepID=UPI000346CEB9|nr:hypothetical protein [Rhodopseudomonas sp. B29]